MFWFHFLANEKRAQQSVHLTCGILRHFQAFFWLRVFPAPKQNPRPPTRRQRKTLGCWGCQKRVCEVQRQKDHFR